MSSEAKPVDEAALAELAERMKLICSADPAQYHNEYSLRRYLRAFSNVDQAFQAILKTNKWRTEYGVEKLREDAALLERYGDKARVLRHRDLVGRPVVYIPAKNHNNDRDIHHLTRFIVHCLEDASHKCFKEVVDNFCIVFNLRDFTVACMDYAVRKNLIWLLSRHYLELEDASHKCFEEVVDNFCIVFDLRDFTVACMDYAVLKNLIWLLSRHYPERLGVCLIINAPAFFSGCWAVIKGWLDENTANKVTFVNSELELCKYLIPDILPTDM